MNELTNVPLGTLPITLELDIEIGAAKCQSTLSADRTRLTNPPTMNNQTVGHPEPIGRF